MTEKQNISLAIGLLAVDFAGGAGVGWEIAKNHAPASVAVSDAATMIAAREVEVLQLRQQLQRLIVEANQVVSNQNAEIQRLIAPKTNK